MRRLSAYVERFTVSHSVESRDPNDSFASDSETSIFQLDEELGLEFTSVTGSKRFEMNEHGFYLQLADADRFDLRTASDLDPRSMPISEEARCAFVLAVAFVLLLMPFATYPADH